MRHKTVATTVTDTDQGLFSALAATWSVDRQNERIVPGAFKATIDRWRAGGRWIPLHWDLRGKAENVIGSVDPSSARETAEGLYVEGKLDLEDSAVAREAWRSMRADTVGLSFGFLVTADRKPVDGVRELLGIDLYEISIVAAPANTDTRLLSLKSAANDPALDRELAAINAAWDDARHLLGTKAGGPRTKSTRPITIKTFEC